MHDLVEMTNDKIADENLDNGILVANDITDKNENKINLQPKVLQPIPQPSEPGLVLHRGKWMRKEKLEKITKKRLQIQKLAM